LGRQKHPRESRRGQNGGTGGEKKRESVAEGSGNAAECKCVWVANLRTSLEEVDPCLSNPLLGNKEKERKENRGKERR